MRRFGFVFYRWLSALLLALALLPACETTKRGFPEMGAGSTNDTDSDVERRHRMEAVSRQIARVGSTDEKIEYIVPRAQLATAFIRQFNDGTVVDRVTINKVQDTPQSPATYYVVGLGLHNGRFQAMAIPLRISTDNSLYLSSAAARYIITSVGCTTCYFRFEKSQITGTTCAENSGGSRCDLRVEDRNEFFPRR